MPSDTYRQIYMMFGLCKMSTEQLIAEYYHERLNEQYSVIAPEYGTITLRSYFHHDFLCVEIFSAKDVIPLDPTGFSDPFVVIELLPKWIFPDTPQRTTQVRITWNRFV